MVCAILFLAFTVVYLYCYEADILVLEQHRASAGQTRYDPLVGAVLLTLTLCALQLLVAFVTGLKGIFHALTYFPSILLLTMLCDGDSASATAPMSYGWVVPLVLLLVLWGAVAWLARRYQTLEQPMRQRGLLTQLTFANLLTLGLQLLIPCLAGNHDRDFHERVHQEYLITRGRYGEARQFIAATDAHQTMVKAYCLTKDTLLPDSLFTLPVPRRQTSLLPGTECGHFLLMADSTVMHDIGYHRDVRLCQRLLKRQLLTFTARLSQWYGRRTRLPLHYREAIALCRELNGEKSVEEYPREPMDTTLMDFQRLREEQKKDSLYLRYSKSYWYYYYGLPLR